MSRLLTKFGVLSLSAVVLWGGENFTRRPVGKPSANRPVEIQDVGLQQKMNAQVPLNLPFVDEAGQQVNLSQYFHGRPVILTLNYYQCPMLCTLELTGLLKSLRVLSLTAGKEFDVVTVSFDANETPALAAAKRNEYLARYKRPEAYQGWHFLTGSPESIKKLADSVGFQFKYLEAKKEYSHPAAIMVLTPEGRVARYLLGIEYSGRDLKFALMDAARGKIGNPVDQVLLYCFHYDPTAGKYTMTVMNVIRVASLLTLIVLMTFVIVMFRRDHLVTT